MIDEAVILAAGLGTRFKGYIGKPKIFLDIKGMPLIMYPILVLKSIGVRRFNIVTSEAAEKDLENLLSRISDIDYCIVVNRDVERENGYSFYLTRGCVRSEYFIISMSDHIYSPNIPLSLIEALGEGVDLIIGGDSMPRFIDVDEATKILYRGNKLYGIGKGLQKYTHIDIGVFIARKTIYDVAQKLLVNRVIRFSDIIMAMARQGYNIMVYDVMGGYWTEIDTVRDLEELLHGNRLAVLKHVLEHLRKYGVM